VTAAVAYDAPTDGWTTDDLDAMPEDGHRRELIDGVLIVSPSPTNFHQTIAGCLMFVLRTSCPPEYDVTQAVEIRISRRRSLTPDVLVVLDPAAARGPSKFEPHEVVLAVEVMSPSSVTMDRVAKPALYAQAGIPYYWRVETDGGIVVFAYRLDPVTEIYEETGRFDTAIHLGEPWPIDIPLAQLRPRHL
jgi:Uma2 family endonuclease